MSDRLDGLRAVGALGPLDVHFARVVARLADETDVWVQLAAALTSRQVREGHVCLDLRQLSAEGTLTDGDNRPLTGDWPAIGEWLAQLQRSRMVGGAEGETPLVLDTAGRLYLRRYWEHEQVLARALQARAERQTDPQNRTWLKETVDRLFAAGGLAVSPEQRHAALLASQSQLCIISGGPGTGKTFTVVRILALLIEQALHRQARPPRIALAAPTGKAAQRLNETIARVKTQLRCDASVVAAIPENAGTIHRLLGAIEGSDTRFVHHRENPIHADVVLVDEASMVDLALMRRLVDAVSDDARLILIGDKDQLASVAAGAVLGDICNAGRPSAYTAAFAERWHAAVGEPLPARPADAESGVIGDCIVELTTNFRYGKDTQLGALAAAIKQGDFATVLSLLDGLGDDLSRVTPTASGSPPEAWLRSRARAFRGIFEAPHESDWTARVQQQLNALARVRVLCAHRRGASGVDEINRRVEQLLQDEGLIDARSSNYAGRPIIVTRNDYQAQLYNGDIGLMLPEVEGEDSLCVWFDGAQGQLRRLAPARLPPHETVFAMTVHKSQGSELDEIAVVLPPVPSPIVSRELLYTAVTRARSRVSVCATREVLEAAVKRQIQRSSGLRDALWRRGG